MQFNPYRAKLDQLNIEFAHAGTTVACTRLDCERFDLFDVAHVKSQEADVAAALPERALKIQRLTERLQAAKSVIEDLSSKSSFGFNPMFWFSEERQKLLQQLEEARKLRASIVQAVKEANASLEGASKKAKQIDEALWWYTSFDRASAGERLNQLNQRIAEIQAHLPGLERQAVDLDVQLAPTLDDLAAAQRRKDDAQRLIAAAGDFDHRLTVAANSYEKRMIHEECRSKLGNDKPSQLVSRARRDAEAADRDIEKLRRSATQVAKRQSRHINRIIFDGNNLCYARSKEFIGIAPLIAIARELKNDVNKIMVFDASIRRHGFNEQKLVDAIGSGVTVHIVNGAADETILDLASGENDYVVSNDKFVDYRSKPAVSGGRVFRHERVDNTIMIHELGVSTTYA